LFHASQLNFQSGTGPNWKFLKWTGAKLGIPEMDQGQIGNSRNGPGPNWEFPKWTRAKLGIAEMDQGQIGNSQNGPGPNWEFPKWTRAKLGIHEMGHLIFSDSVLVFVRGAVWHQEGHYCYIISQK